MWFEKMGIYGIPQSIENAVIAGLATGDPVLFIGNHGTAKTLLCRKLAEALNLNFFSYDASKALFEDLIGFPNPDTISKGEIEYVPTKLSIWNKEFILIDEISRARVEMQNKWLEVIRERKVMGIKARSLRYVFAAMNPSTYAGANPLDEALAGRFAFIIKIPQVIEMKSDDVKKILNNVTREDGVALDCNNERCLSEEEKKSFNEHINKIRHRVNQFSVEFKNKTDDYLIRFIQVASDKGLILDGRRVNAMKRNVLSYISASINSDDDFKNVDFYTYREKILEVMKFSLPFEACNVEVSNSRINKIHEFVFDYINDGGDKNKIFNVKKIEDMEIITDDLVAKNYEWVKSLITSIIEKVKSKEYIEEKPLKVELLRSLVKKVANREINLEINDVERLFEAYKNVYKISTNIGCGISELYNVTKMMQEDLIDSNPDAISDYKIVFTNLCNPETGQILTEKLRKSIITYKNFSERR
ncbi:MAG: MoxR family ATPase [Candidatus Goldbacteria bacterium]|nr:MoxR family ATPase [Candidatus Goldiibacteriota bacterium]